MSLSIEVELLTERYVATCFNDRNRGEWPPHLARLFSAAVAAWAQEDRADSTEREVLEWLEGLAAPTIACSPSEDVSQRTVVTHFVPVNDPPVGSSIGRAYGRRALPAAAIEVLPAERVRQGRTFPSVTPPEPRVVFTWPDAEPTSAQRATLDGLLARIGRLGHSSSLVSCAVTEDAPTPTLAPDAGGELVIRVPGPGQFELLEEEFARHKGVEPRTLPAAMQPYTRVSSAAAEAPGPVFSRRWIVFVLDSDATPVSIRASLPLARALRAAFIEHARDDAPELLSGRGPRSDGDPGKPSCRPHAAIVPLPFVGHRYADSLVRGVAVVLPVEVAAEERHALLRAIARWEQESDCEVRLGSRRIQLARGDGLDMLGTLRPQTWCLQSTEWATVTPLALDRFPGDLRARDPQRQSAADGAARATIARACEHIGLPAPAEVLVRPDAAVSAVPPVRAFPVFQTPNGGPRRALVHAHLRFAEPIVGPLLLGAGRYVGQGLCLPLRASGPDASGPDG